MGPWNDSLKATLRFERPERICQFEWGYWPETLARWRREGMPAGEPWDAAGITFYHRVPVEVRLFPQGETVVLSESEESRIIRDGAGIVMEVPKSGATVMPRFLHHPVANLRDFE